MKPIALVILCACLADGASAAGGRGGVRGAKSGALLSAAPTAAPASSASGRAGGSAVLGTGVVAGRALYGDPRYAPPMDPRREVSEQDCTKPVDLTRGNLKCR
jgi:hypothetical protein